MKTKKNEKKLELKKITITNLINQEMVIVRGGCPTTTATSSDLGTADCVITTIPFVC